MSKICVTTIVSILIVIFTCKQITHSEPNEFSKNGVFHRNAVVIFFIPDVEEPQPYHMSGNFMSFCATAAENISKSNC